MAGCQVTYPIWALSSHYLNGNNINITLWAVCLKKDTACQRVSLRVLYILLLPYTVAEGLKGENI